MTRQISILLIVMLGFFLTPTLTYACGKPAEKTEKSCCKKETSKTEKKDCCESHSQKDKNDEGEQQGMMFLYSGIYLAFRNQRAHKLIEDTPEHALGIINTISFLAKLLDKAKLRQNI